MDTLKETKYLRFIIFIKEGKKTKDISVINVHHDEVIGEIKWYSAWRQYCFFPGFNTIWNKDCLNAINEVIGELMDARKPAPKKIKTVGVIARSLEDFQNWRREHKHKSTPHAENTQRRYVYRGKRYIGISTSNHCCGNSFDEVIATETAYLNSEYSNIISIIKPTLVPGGKWMGRKL